MNNFKDFRIKMGLTQEQLADLLDIHKSSISRYEHGSLYPSMIICHKLLNLAKLKNIRVKIEFFRPDLFK